MSTGPIDLVVIGFPGNQFKGEILPEIQRVVDAGIVRLLDILLAIRIGDDPVRILEINEVEDEGLKRFTPVASDMTGILTEQDAYALSAGIEPNSSVALLLFEHLWSTRVSDAIEAAGGQLIMNERLPRAVVQELVDEAAAGAAG